MDHLRRDHHCYRFQLDRSHVPAFTQLRVHIAYLFSSQIQLPFRLFTHTFSTSLIPPSVITYVASLSGQSGLSCTRATRSSPLPLRRSRRVADAWARMCPPTGLRPSAALAKRAEAPGSDWTWFVCRAFKSVNEGTKGAQWV